MNGIKVLLVVSIVLLGFIYFQRFRSRILDKLIIIIIVISGITCVILPELTSKVANLIGVGRGTDLLLYISLVFILFILLLLYSKLRSLQQNITTIIRSEAIKNVKRGKKKSEEMNAR